MSEREKENPTGNDEMSLEAILAEYKGADVVANRKKSSQEELNRKTEQILKETLGELRKESPGDVSFKLPRSQAAVDATIPLPTVPLSEIETVREASDATIPLPTVPLSEIETARETSNVTIPQVSVAEPTIQLPKLEIETVKPVQPQEATMPLAPAIQSEPMRPEAPKLPTGQAIPEQVVAPIRRQKLEPGQVVSIPFPSAPQADSLGQRPQVETQAFTDEDELRYADQSQIEKFSATLEEVGEDEEDEEEEDQRGGFLGRFGRGRKQKDLREEPDVPDYEAHYDDPELTLDDLSPLKAAGKYGKGLSGYHLRGLGTILLALFMLLFTGLGDAGRSLPGFMSTFRGLTATLLVMQLFAMFLTAEVLTTGLLDIFRRRIGAETLVTVAALASLGDAVWILRMGAPDRGLPYAAVVSFALATALLGQKSTRNAMKTTLRTAATGSNPYVVTSRPEESGEGFSLLKSRGELEGFVRKTEQIDFSEYAYSMMAPLLLVMSVVFAFLAVLGGGGEMRDVIRYFSAMALVSASFTGLLTYGLPFAMLARKLTKVGTALAGWGGAAEVAAAKGIIITDKDVFPLGTLSLGGVKIFRSPGPERERVIAAASSLIIESGVGLSEVFVDIMRKEELHLLPVEDLTCYEGGGLGAKVAGAELLVGSASLMNLTGIRLPQNLSVKNAVFAAIDGELAGVFAINYVPQASVMEALVSLLQTKVKPLFALRDFNITPIMLQNKFHISADKIDFLTYEERYALSVQEPDERARPFAVLHREGLRPLVDVVVGGKRLWTAVVRNTVLSLASSVIGLILLLSFFWAGAAETASAVNLFYYLAAWLVVICLLSRTVDGD